MVRALITGIGGQDGGYLAEQLLADGAQVHGLVRAADLPGPAGTTGAPGGTDAADLSAATLHTVDLTDTGAVAGLIKDLAPDEVYNLAAVSSVARSWADPLETGQVSGLAVAGLLQACWELTESGHPVRFVQASSAEIFGNAETSPQDEDTPLRPVNPYGAAKAYAHLLTGVYRARGLHAGAVVLYNHESPRRPVGFVTRKITRAAADIARGRADELALGNLDARRDWGWAPDYVDALVRAARHDVPGDYVIATGESHTVAEFVAAAFTRAGVPDWQRHVRVDPAFVRPVDATELRGDAGRARRELGWTPTRNFTDVVSAMVDADLLR